MLRCLNSINVNPLEVTYNFKCLETMLRSCVLYREQFLNNGLKVEYKLYIGINEFQAIFVVE
jgi:hypothetical protein